MSLPRRRPRTLHSEVPAGRSGCVRSRRLRRAADFRILPIAVPIGAKIVTRASSLLKDCHQILILSTLRPVAQKMLLSFNMSSRNRAFWSAVFTLALMTLARGQYCLTNVYAVWASSPTWDNPWTLEIEEINTLVSVTALYTNPTREANGRMIAALPRVGPAVLSVDGWTIGAPSRFGQVLGSRHLDLADGPALPSSVTRAPPVS